MKPYKLVFWPVPIFWYDTLPPRRRWFLFGPRDQGNRSASNYGLWIQAERDVPTWTLEQEKFESRFWFMWIVLPVVVFNAILYAVTGTPFAWMLLTVPAGVAGVFAYIWTFWPSLRCDVECASRAQEIRARVDPRRKVRAKHREDQYFIEKIAERYARILAADYANSIHEASNYPFFAVAGWTVDDVCDRILKHL